MHRQVLEFIERVQARLPEAAASMGIGLEVGSMDINGSARGLFPRLVWLGVDWRPGPNVDVVTVFHEWRPGRQFDVVLSTEMLEHDLYWRRSVVEMIEALRMGGNLFITCAARGRAPHEPDVGIDGHYQGLDLTDVLPVVLACADWGTVVAEQRTDPADTYIAALGKRSSMSPRVSVVTPMVQEQYIGRFLKTHRSLQAGLVEYVVVSNGTAEEEYQRVMELRPNVLLHYDQPIGWPKACNVGAAMTHRFAPVLVLANDDTEMTLWGWDGRLAEIVACEPNLGAISPALSAIANRWQQAHVMPIPDLYEAPLLFYAWVAFPRAVWEKVGGLDEAFLYGNGDDIDHSLRIREAGGRLLVDPVTAVYHRMHGAFGLMSEEQFGGLMENARQVLRRKWGTRIDELAPEIAGWVMGRE